MCWHRLTSLGRPWSDPSRHPRAALAGSQGSCPGARGRIDLWQSPESMRLDWLCAGLEEIPLAGKEMDLWIPTWCRSCETWRARQGDPGGARQTEQVDAGVVFLSVSSLHELEAGIQRMERIVADVSASGLAMFNPWDDAGQAWRRQHPVAPAQGPLHGAGASMRKRLLPWRGSPQRAGSERGSAGEPQAGSPQAGHQRESPRVLVPFPRSGGRPWAHHSPGRGLDLKGSPACGEPVPGCPALISPAHRPAPATSACPRGRRRSAAAHAGSAACW